MRDKKALERALKPYEQCHDCGVREGELHWPGCDMESCPSCGWQLLSCGCIESYDEIKDEDRIPYIMYPNMCARSGELWPDMFTVPTEEWEHYIEPRIRGEQLCRECYDEIKGIIDRHDQS